MNKEQDENEKPTSLDPTAMLPDITLLINERDYLQEEVRSLRENLSNEHVRYTELKTLKNQQVCALTFKLAKAIRDKERALEEKDEINQKISSLQDRIDELEVQNSTLQDKLVALERQDSTEDNSSNDPPLANANMSCFAVTGAKNIHESNTSLHVNMEDNPPSDDKEPEQEEDHETADEPPGESEPVEGCPKEDFIEEFRKIQQELSDVKKNMSVVQALNEKLSNDLERLSDLKQTGTVSRSNSADRCSGVTDYTDSPVVCVEKTELHESGSDGSSDGESIDDSPNDTKRTEYHDISNGEVDFKKQLEQAMKELEDIRADNLEIKQQMNKMTTSSIDHQDFMRKTTNFTGKMLQEMKDREERRSRKASADSQPPLNLLGNRLDEIMKAVDDMTPVPPRPQSACLLASQSDPVPHRPQSACLLLASQSDFIPITQETQGNSRSHHKPINKPHGKLSDVTVYKSLTSGVAGLRKTSAPLQRDWKSTEFLAPKPKTSFSGSLGYRDYIQRHIVTSSSAIAKIRDLTPEELANQEQITY